MATPPFIRELRARIGTTLLVLPSASAFILDEAGRALVVRHSHDGRWTLPGGCVEPDEAPESTIVREVREETGLVVEALSVLGVGGGPDYRLRYENGDEVSYVATVYHCRVAAGDVRPDGDEILETRFVGRRELADLELSSIGQANLKIALKSGAGSDFR